MRPIKDTTKIVVRGLININKANITEPIKRDERIVSNG
jgi:hypothetical protein